MLTRLLFVLSCDLLQNTIMQWLRPQSVYSLSPSVAMWSYENSSPSWCLSFLVGLLWSKINKCKVIGTMPHIQTPSKYYLSLLLEPSIILRYSRCSWMVKIEDAFTNEDDETTVFQNKWAGNSGSNLSMSGATALSRAGELLLSERLTESQYTLLTAAGLSWEFYSWINSASFLPLFLSSSSLAMAPKSLSTS